MSVQPDGAQSPSEDAWREKDPAAAAWIDYEYAWLTLCPSTHLLRGELVGLIVHARKVDFLDVRYHLDETALALRFPGLDLAAVAAALEGCARICAGGPGSGPIGLLPPGERFNWLTAPRSAVVQCSPVFGGRTLDPEATLIRLFAEAVRAESSGAGGSAS